MARDRAEEATHLDDEELIAAANEALDRVLSFYSRVDTRASILLGVNTGMLGYLASKLPPSKEWDIRVLAAVIPLVLLALSLFQLYRCAYPALKGGHGSLQYFREIAKLTESRFITDFKAQTRGDVAEDLLGQLWRNSEILADKFGCLRCAFALCAAAIPFWAVSIALLRGKG